MQLPRRVVVSGLGLISRIGNSVQESWSNCVEGRSGISKTTVDLEGMPVKVGGRIKNFDTTHYIDSKDVRRLDTFVQYGVSAGIQALEDAGIDDNINKDRVGLNIGSGIGGLDSIEKNKDILDKKSFSSSLSRFTGSYSFVLILFEAKNDDFIFLDDMCSSSSIIGTAWLKV